jgi:hypothetical protein
VDNMYRHFDKNLILHVHIFEMYLSKHKCLWIQSPEDGNDTLKCNNVTCYRLCYILRTITSSSDNVSNLDRAITLKRDKGSYVPKAMKFRNDNFLYSDNALCDDAKCNLALSL